MSEMRQWPESYRKEEKSCQKYVGNQSGKPVMYTFTEKRKKCLQEQWVHREGTVVEDPLSGSSYHVKKDRTEAFD